MLNTGHVGARANEPENTLRSCRKALPLSVDAVELDVPEEIAEYVKKDVDRIAIDRPDILAKAP